MRCKDAVALALRDYDEAENPRGLVELVRAAYPAPRTLPGRAPGEWSDADYCVGGALLMYLHGREITCAFPGRSELASELRELGTVGAQQYAEEIIRLNDRGQFARAWRVLADALNGCAPPAEPAHLGPWFDPPVYPGLQLPELPPHREKAPVPIRPAPVTLPSPVVPVPVFPTPAIPAGVYA